MNLGQQLAAAAALGLCLATAAQAQTKAALQVVGNLGITTQYKELEAPFWTKQVPAATEGRITASIKPWNEMGLKGPEVFRMLGQGVFDVGTTQLGFMAGDNAINDATDLAGVSPDIETFWKVTQAFRPHLETYYAQQVKVKPLAMLSFQAQVLFCRDEIKGLADLKGRKVRTSGASQADFVSYFGGSGVNMAFGEVQQSLQNGVIDCAITGTLGGYKAKWYDGARYLYSLPINFGAAMSAINTGTWNKLDPATQKTLQGEYVKLEKAVYDQNVRENDLGLACNTGGQCSEGPPAKMTLVKPSAADLELRKKALVEQVIPRWAARCGAACVKNWNESVGKVVGLTAAVSAK
ncbi:MAG TPA: TRAP transporter substrate-binding protein [Ramlibacter sp.]|nr:TRAP transporter substrate-binding protein [Ramlibacter sp.]